MLGLAWCFGIASIAHELGLFYETGAFFAGVTMAWHPIAQFIAEKLKPLRDFFLVMFFFSLGAKLDLLLILDTVFPAIVLAAIFVVVKPLVMQWGFKIVGESPAFSKEAGIRLGHLSEFSLLIAVLAINLELIGAQASQLIQTVAILTFIISSYRVIFNYPTPIGTSEKLIRD